MWCNEAPVSGAMVFEVIIGVKLFKNDKRCVTMGWIRQCGWRYEKSTLHKMYDAEQIYVWSMARS